MEIRIKITEQEFTDVESRAMSSGYPSINAYVRELIFPEHDYSKKWAEVKAAIAQRDYDDEPFYIRDLLPNPPALFGRWAYEQQNELSIELDGKDRTGTNRWRKKQGISHMNNSPLSE